MVKIRVIKGFVFSTPAPAGTNGPAIEKYFGPGDHEIPDEMWQHKWIRTTLAEGRIESPQQTLARAKKELETAEAAKAIADSATDQANAAFARLQANNPGILASKEEIEAELNTPVTQLKRKGAVGK